MIQILINQKMLIVRNKKSVLDLQRIRRKDSNPLLKRKENSPSSLMNMRRMRKRH